VHRHQAERLGRRAAPVHSPVEDDALGAAVGDGDGGIVRGLEIDPDDRDTRALGLEVLEGRRMIELEALHAPHVEDRTDAGEKLAKDSPIITFKVGYGATGYADEEKRSISHITTKTLTKEIRDAMRPRFDWRPYVLRAYFDTQLMVAENHGKISHAYRQFFMGHNGDIEARYTTNKGRLPDEVVEDMRGAYRKCQEYLQTLRSESDSEERLRDSFRRQLLLVAGFKVEEIDEMDLSMDDASFQETVRKRLLGQSREGGDASQRVVSVGDVDSYLSKGWGYMASLPGDRVILRTPFDFSTSRV
jgi:hypothetical protein